MQSRQESKHIQTHTHIWAGSCEETYPKLHATGVTSHYKQPIGHQTDRENNKMEGELDIIIMIVIIEVLSIVLTRKPKLKNTPEFNKLLLITCILQFQIE